MTAKMFVFMGRTNPSCGDRDGIWYGFAESVDKADGEVWRENQTAYHRYYDVAYEADSLPKHLTLSGLNGDAWRKGFLEIVRLINLGAVPDSYMRVDGKWYKADQNLLEQGCTNFDLHPALESVRVLKGAIIQEHDARRFGGVVVKKPQFAPPDILSEINFDNFPNPSDEMLEMIETFIENVVPKDESEDRMSATRDIARRFS